MISEQIHAEQSVLIAPSKVSPDASWDGARMPNDCAMHWAAELDRLSTMSGNRLLVKFCKQQYRQTFQQFISHQMTFAQSRQYFRNAAIHCRKAGFPDLATLAQKMLLALPGPEHDDFALDKSRIKYKNALHDNIYGRAYGSFVSARMFAAPSPEMVETIQKMSAWLPAQIFSGMEAGKNGQIELGLDHHDMEHICALQKEFRNLASNWREELPAGLKEFAAHGDVEKAGHALLSYLSAAKRNPAPIDLLAIPHLMYAAISSDPRELEEWACARERQYAVFHGMRQRFTVREDHRQAILKHAENLYKKEKSIDRSRFDEMTQLAGTYRKTLFANAVQDRAAGITLIHQPAAVSLDWLASSARPVNQNRPNFSRHPIELKDNLDIADDDTEKSHFFTRAVKNRLMHGEAYGADLSGVSNVFLHSVAEANRHGYGFDVSAVLKVVSMYMSFDGGHDISECYGVARLQDGDGKDQLKLGLGLGSSSPDADFVFDYNMMCDGEGDVWMQDILKASFDDTVAYFNEHSRYASAVE